MGRWLFTSYQNGTDVDEAFRAAQDRNRREVLDKNEQASLVQKSGFVLLGQPPMALAEAVELAQKVAMKEREAYGDYDNPKCGALRTAGDDGQHDGFLFFGLANE